MSLAGKNYVDPIGNPINYDIEEKYRLLEANLTPQAKIVRSDFTREHPIQVTFEKSINLHDRTPQVQVAVSSYSELITGTEMVFNTDNKKAQKFLEDWSRAANFYDKFEGLVTTTLICGNSILEKLDENDTQDVMEVDMSTIIAKKRDEVGKLQYYEARSQNGMTNKLGEGHLGKFIEFNLTMYSRQSWGKSLFYSISIPRTIGNRTSAPVIESLWAIEDAMAAIYINNAYPITTITYPAASDDYLRKESIRWQKYKPGDKRVQKIKPEIEFAEISGSQSKFTEIIDHIEKLVELGTQFPHDILTGDFTSRASSETTESIVMKRVRGYQRYLGNKLKNELFDPILIQNGFDPEEVMLTISFAAQNVIEVTPDQVKDRVATGLWTKSEGREWDRENIGVELPDDDEIKSKEDEMNKQNELAQKDMDNKDKEIDNLGKKVERLIIEHNLSKENVKLKERMQHKFELINKANKENNDKLAQTRIESLEKIIAKVDELG